MFSFIKSLFSRNQEQPQITKEQIITEYNKHPKLCKQCRAPIPYNKRRQSFCCVSHGVSYNNRLRNTEQKRDQKWLKKQALIEASGQFPCNPRTSKTNNKVAKKYLIHKYGARCSICGLKKSFYLLQTILMGTLRTIRQIISDWFALTAILSCLHSQVGTEEGGRQSRQYNYWSSK